MTVESVYETGHCDMVLKKSVTGGGEKQGKREGENEGGWSGKQG